MKGSDAALIVDIQGDFTEWKQGSLAVPDTGEDYVRLVEQAAVSLKGAGFLIFASQDWHPPGHVSFASTHAGKKPMDIIAVDGRTQTLWPDHCIQGTENARVLVDNDIFLAILRKGQDHSFDSYSAFRDDGGTKTGLESTLMSNSVGRIAIFGLATDYCVRATALDALALRYEVVVLNGLCRGVQPVSSTIALDAMKAQGAKIIEEIVEI
jgi:nicotinamidase/pyrazinamidase